MGSIPYLRRMVQHGTFQVFEPIAHGIPKLNAKARQFMGTGSVYSKYTIHPIVQFFILRYLKKQ